MKFHVIFFWLCLMAATVLFSQFARKSSGRTAHSLHCGRSSWGCWKEANFQVGCFCLPDTSLQRDVTCDLFSEIILFTGFLLLPVRFLLVKWISYSKLWSRTRRLETSIIHLSITFWNLILSLMTFVRWLLAVDEIVVFLFGTRTTP